MPVLSTFVALVGAAFVGTWIWMRRGRTTRSRFWVRRWTSWCPRPAVDAEVLFLVWWPVLGTWLLIAGLSGLIQALGVGPRNLFAVVVFGGGLLALAVIVVLMIGSGITRVSMPGRTNLLRPWMYPRRLRRLRAIERRWEREQLLPAWERSEVGTRPWTTLEENEAPGGARDRAFAALNKDLRRAARRSGAPVLTISQTSNESVRCPALIPTLLDWYENAEAKTRLARPRDRAQLLDAVARSLVTPDAPHETTFRLAVRYLDSHPPVPQAALQGSTLLASHHASPSDPGDRADMARLAGDRVLGEGRAPILEWLIARKVSRRHPDLLGLAIDELEDPVVAAHIMRRLRRLPPDALPADIEDRVRPYLRAQQDESRRQARLLLERIAVGNEPAEQ